MASRLILLSLLSCFVLFAEGRASPEELALRAAITSPGPATFFLTKDIHLTADLPLIADGKVLVVRGNSTGKRFHIDGLRLYHLFRSQKDAVVKLCFYHVSLTRSFFAAVEINGPGAELCADYTQFSFCRRGVNLNMVNVNISNSFFYGNRRAALYARTEEVGKSKVVLSKCMFSNNNADPGSEAGGAIRVFNSTQLIADECTFEKNSAFNGGAVGFSAAYGTLTKCKFLSNKATFSGGALSAFDSEVSVQDTLFYMNTAVRGNGGAVRISSGGAGSNVVFKRTSFQVNSAVKGGAFEITGSGVSVAFCSVGYWRNTVNGTLNVGYVSGDNLVIRTSARIPFLTIADGTALTFPSAAATCA